MSDGQPPRLPPQETDGGDDCLRSDGPAASAKCVNSRKQRGRFISTWLSGYPGKWVLLCFSTGDLTFVRATEFSAVAEKYDEFQKLGVETLFPRIDRVFVHKMRHDKELSLMVEGGVPSPVLAVAGGRVGKACGDFDEDAEVESRGRLIIDPEDLLAGMRRPHPPVGRGAAGPSARFRRFSW